MWLVLVLLLLLGLLGRLLESQISVTRTPEHPAGVQGFLAELYVRGADVDWKGLDQPFPRRKVPLPSYPFQRKHHWMGPWGGVAAPASQRTSSRRQLG